MPNGSTGSGAGERPFELAFVTAGAVSAGAYTAGVMDFLFEALDAWAASAGAKDTGLAAGEAVPALDVVVKAISGASAGGINAAIAAAVAPLDFKPVRLERERDTARQNPFYRTWVDGISISTLLSTDDLREGSALASVLNTTVLETLSRQAVDFSGTFGVPYLKDLHFDAPDLVREGTAVETVKRRAWLADPFHLDLSVTNLQGVPYGIQFEGNTGRYHEMILHKDYMSFLVPVAAPVTQDRPATVTLGPVRASSDQTWAKLATASLATGAFPVALKARRLSRSPDDYNLRFNLDDGDSDTAVARAWPGGRERPENGPYEFYTVDGGAMNNEPYDLARLAFSDPVAAQDTPGAYHDHAILMIDPFTDPRSSVPARTDALGPVAAQVIGALMAQSRFRISDLKRAARKDSYTHFMIAPARGRLLGDRALASSGLAGFLGFFARSFRAHDFFLGRHNCQSFLSRYFTLPEDHPRMQARLKADKAFWERFRASSRTDKAHYAVIPLVNGLDRPLSLPDWPDATDYWEREALIRHSVSRRVKALLKVMKADLAGPLRSKSKLLKWALDLYLWPALSFSSSAISDGIMDMVEDEVRAIAARRGEALEDRGAGAPDEPAPAPTPETDAPMEGAHTARTSRGTRARGGRGRSTAPPAPQS